MKFTKGFTVILGLTISLHSFSQKNCDFKTDSSRNLLNESLDSFLIKLENETFDVGHNKKDIPAFIKKALDCWAHNFTIADPGKPFNATDINNRGLPIRQLLYTAKSKDLFIMTYLHGGIGLSAKILFIKYHDSVVLDVWSSVCTEDLKSNEAVIDYIKMRRDKGWGLNANIIGL